jgi:hypothetical protein
MLIPFDIVVLWVSFYISFMHVSTLLMLSMSLVNTCKQTFKVAHLQAMISIFHYLRCYPSCGIYYIEGEENTLHSYLDVEFVQDVDD